MSGSYRRVRTDPLVCTESDPYASPPMTVLCDAEEFTTHVGSHC